METLVIEFSPVTNSAAASAFNIEAMIEAYSLLKECFRYMGHEGLSADEAVTVTRYLTSVYTRLGSVSDMPHRVVYVAQIVVELTRLRKWLICQVETEIREAVGSHLIPSWIHAAPTEDFPPGGAV